MDYLFSETGSQALDYAVVGRTLFAFDFDELWRAPPPPERAAELRHALRQLASQARVAVVSSQPRASLLAQLPDEIRYVVGRDGEPRLTDGPLSKREALAAVQQHSRCGAMVVVSKAHAEPLFDDAPSDWLTVQIGAPGPGPARYFVNDANEVTALLHALLARLGGTRALTPPARPAA
ncbi:hypothetical protein [Aquabacterium sp.]|uniref:hypothetical protein n=1 Tax=Aquabacterium sp. TaxID=1872578 RepID=UPI0035ADA72A